MDEACENLDLEEVTSPDAWAELMKKVEMEFPTEFEGTRDPGFYFEWKFYGQPVPETYGDAVPATIEDYPELVDKHPKEVPRCI